MEKELKALPPHKAIIFDLDGTLVDSLGVWSGLCYNWLEQNKLPPFPGMEDALEDMTLEEAAELFVRHYKLEITEADIFNQWGDMICAGYQNVEMFPFAKEFLEKQHSIGVKIGLATASFEQPAVKLLKRLEIHHLFDALTFVSEVSRGKNFADVYLLAAKRLGVNPTDCIVFEDIYSALFGIKAANMTSVAVKNHLFPRDWDKFSAQADFAIESYCDIL